MSSDNLGESIDDEVPLDWSDGWYINNEERAAFAVDRLLSRRADLARIRAASAAWIERAEKDLARAEAVFVPQLAAWMLEHPPAKGQTLHFATGSFAARKQPERIEVTDEAACIAWAKAECPELLTSPAPVQPAPRIIRAELTRLRALLGDVPGTAIVPETVTFAVKAPKEKP